MPVSVLVSVTKVTPTARNNRQPTYVIPGARQRNLTTQKASKMQRDIVTVRRIGRRNAWYVNGEFVAYQPYDWYMIDMAAAIAQIWPGAKLA